RPLQAGFLAALGADRVLLASPHAVAQPGRAARGDAAVDAQIVGIARAAPDVGAQAQAALQGAAAAGSRAGALAADAVDALARFAFGPRAAGGAVLLGDSSASALLDGDSAHHHAGAWLPGRAVRVAGAGLVAGAFRAA